MKKPIIAISMAENERINIPATYFDAVLSCGGIPIMAYAGDAENFAPAILTHLPPPSPAAIWCAHNCDGLLLSGGGDIDPQYYGQMAHPEASVCLPRHDASDLALFTAFMAAQKPIFGLCRGCQVINVALGGTLIQHLPDAPGVTIDHRSDATRHTAILTENGFLHKIFNKNEITVNSTHHQAIGVIAPGLRTAALSPDGVIEAVQPQQNSSHRAYGVQFHPERLPGEVLTPIFNWFISLCKSNK